MGSSGLSCAPQGRATAMIVSLLAVFAGLAAWTPFSAALAQNEAKTRTEAFGGRRLGFQSEPARLTIVPGIAARMLITLPGEHMVRVLDLDGNPVQQFLEVKEPVGIAVGAERVYIGSTREGSVEVFDFRHAEIGSRRGHLGTGSGEFGRPVAIAISPLSGAIFVSDVRRGQLRYFDAVSLTEVGTIGVGKLTYPAGLAFATDGTLYVADLMAGEVLKFKPDLSYAGKLTRQGDDPGETVRPIGIAVDRAGRAYVVDAFFGRVQVYRADGTFLTNVGAIGKGPGRVETPQDIALHPHRQTMFVTDGVGKKLATYDIP